MLYSSPRPFLLQQMSDTRTTPAVNVEEHILWACVILARAQASALFGFRCVAPCSFFYRRVDSLLVEIYSRVSNFRCDAEFPNCSCRSVFFLFCNLGRQLGLNLVGSGLVGNVESQALALVFHFKTNVSYSILIESV